MRQMIRLASNFSALVLLVSILHYTGVMDAVLGATGNGINSARNRIESIK